VVSFPNGGTNRDGFPVEETLRPGWSPSVIFANERTSVYTRANTSSRSRTSYETVVIYPRSRGVAASRRDRKRTRISLGQTQMERSATRRHVLPTLERFVTRRIVRPRSPLPFKRDTLTRVTPQRNGRSLHVAHALEGTNFRRAARPRRPLRKLRAALTGRSCNLWTVFVVRRCLSYLEFLTWDCLKKPDLKGDLNLGFHPVDETIAASWDYLNDLEHKIRLWTSL